MILHTLRLSLHLQRYLDGRGHLKLKSVHHEQLSFRLINKRNQVDTVTLLPCQLVTARSVRGG